MKLSADRRIKSRNYISLGHMCRAKCKRKSNEIFVRHAGVQLPIACRQQEDGRELKRMQNTLKACQGSKHKTLMRESFCRIGMKINVTNPGKHVLTGNLFRPAWPCNFITYP
jgi:hypothetical protein